jgi:nucleoside 2-deoxyribosyltransferase
MGYAKKRLYLAGPITGTQYNESRYGWRKTFVDLLAARDAYHIECYSPMREKEFLEKNQCIEGTADYDSLEYFGTPQGILARDSNDVRHCDAMIACFLGATRPSIGTCVEFGIALECRKPIIMVMEKEFKRVLDRERVTERIPYDVFQRGLNAVGDFLKDKGHDIAGGKIHDQYEMPDGGGFNVTFTVAGKTEIVKNPHDHLFLRACAGYCVPTLEHAADIAKSLLTPGL